MKRQIAATLAALMSISLLAPAAYAEETVPITAPETVIATAESAETALTAENDTPVPTPDADEETLSVADDAPIFYADGSSITASGTCGDKLTWTLDDAGTLTISGTGEMTSHEWTSDEENRKNIKAVVIEEGVTSMSYSAFNSCTALKTVDLPDTLEQIGRRAFDGCSALTAVDIPNSVTSIGGYAFYECSSLTSVRLPETLTGIEEGTFAYCSKLNEITIPDTVTDIGRNVFYNCRSLNKITIPRNVVSLGNCAFSSCSYGIQITFVGDCPTIAEDAFQYTSGTAVYPVGNATWTSDALQNYGGTIVWYAVDPETGTAGGACGADGSDLSWTLDTAGTLTISGTGEMMEYGWYSSFPWNNFNSSIKSLVVEEGCTSISDYAFYGYFGYENLAEITLPNTLKSIGKEAFYGCDSLTEVTLPNSLESIGRSAFYGCDSLKKVTIPSVSELGGYAFSNNSALTEVHLGAGVASEDTSAFYLAFQDLPALTTLTVAEENPNFKSVDNVLFTKDGSVLAFYPQGKNASSYTVPDGVAKIDSFAFRNSGALKQVAFPNSLKEIGESAFQYTGLQKVQVPDSVESIEDSAFASCTDLASVSLGAGLKQLGNCVFQYDDKLSDVAVSAANTAYKSVDGVIYDKTGKTLVAYPAGKAGEQYSIPNSVTDIAYAAFASCDKLLAVDIPSSVSSIGVEAFYGCGKLQSIALPDGIKEIPMFAFYYCDSLTSATLPGQLTKVGVKSFYGCDKLTAVTLPDSITKIDTFAFANCTGLTSVRLPYNLKELGTYVFYGCSDLPEISIPEGIASVPDSTFRYCTNLQKVTIPKTVTSVDRCAFENCSALADVYFTGTEEEWSLVKINNDGNNPLINAAKYFNSPSVEPQPIVTPNDNPFPDVSKDDWFYEDAVYVSENNLMNGIPNAEGETCFEPDASTSRAMVVTILYRMSGCPEVSEANNFSDVENDSWYTDAVIWASENGIVTGYAGTNQFGTNDPITREQMAVMMYRYAQYNGKDTTASASLDSFTDCEQVHSWAKDAFAWANAEGLIGGKPTDDGKFFLDPAGNAVRSQAAAILHRYCENI